MNGPSQKPPSTQRSVFLWVVSAGSAWPALRARSGSFFSVVTAISALLVLCVACGKKGPPLPPLVKLPAAPAEFAAERRGARVDLQFVVPAANTDNTRPANIARVDVYAITTRDTIADDQLVKQGTRVASVDVKTPRDPNATIDEDEPPADIEPPEGEGLDQGTVARVSEELTPEALTPASLAKPRKSSSAEGTAAAAVGPLLPPAPMPLVRSYIAVGVTTRDKKGATSRRLTVPIVPPPPPPGAPTVTYDEKSITIEWPPVQSRAAIQDPPQDGELPSTPVGARPPTIAYNVYEAPANGPSTKLTKTPVADARFSDPRIVWDEERCYTVRAVETIADLTIESDAPPPACRTLKDTFPPAAPAALQSSPGDGTIHLIWDASAEKDLAGYIVLRGASADALHPITPSPIAETSFADQVERGIRFTYAVRAVDKAGNASPLSNTVEEAAR